MGLQALTSFLAQPVQVPGAGSQEGWRREEGMKVLVATRRGQGLRSDDYYFLTDGALVYLGFVCAGHRPDGGGCGCGRAFAGCDSQRGGTTASVAEWPGSRADYATAIAAALVRDGYFDAGDPDGCAVALAHELLELASAFPISVVLERRLDVLQQRRCT